MEVVVDEGKLARRQLGTRDFNPSSARLGGLTYEIDVNFVGGLKVRDDFSELMQDFIVPAHVRCPEIVILAPGLLINSQ